MKRKNSVDQQKQEIDSKKPNTNNYYMNNYGVFTPHIWQKIFCFFSKKELGTVAGTSKTMRALCHEHATAQKLSELVADNSDQWDVLDLNENLEIDCVALSNQGFLVFILSNEVGGDVKVRAVDPVSKKILYEAKGIPCINKMRRKLLVSYQDNKMIFAHGSVIFFIVHEHLESGEIKCKLLRHSTGQPNQPEITQILTFQDKFLTGDVEGSISFWKYDLNGGLFNRKIIKKDNENKAAVTQILPLSLPDNIFVTFATNQLITIFHLNEDDGVEIKYYPAHLNTLEQCDYYQVEGRHNSRFDDTEDDLLNTNALVKLSLDIDGFLSVYQEKHIAIWRRPNPKSDYERMVLLSDDTTGSINYLIGLGNQDIVSLTFEQAGNAVYVWMNKGGNYIKQKITENYDENGCFLRVFPISDTKFAIFCNKAILLYSKLDTVDCYQQLGRFELDHPCLGGAEVQAINLPSGELFIYNHIHYYCWDFSKLLLENQQENINALQQCLALKL